MPFLANSVSYTPDSTARPTVAIFLNLLKIKSNRLYIIYQSYRAVNTFHQGYKNQSVHDV